MMIATNPAYYTEVAKVAKVVNGYQIEKLDCGPGWSVIKVGEMKGKAFKNKTAAIAFAEAQK